jgi:hypothetical protein
VRDLLLVILQSLGDGQIDAARGARDEDGVVRDVDVISQPG